MTIETTTTINPATTIDCTKKWLIEALKQAKPVLFELGLPAYSAHYSQLAFSLVYPLLGRLNKVAVIEEFITTYCDPNLDPISTRKLAIALYNNITALHDILDEEIATMMNEEFKTYIDNPKMKELSRLLYGAKKEEEEEEYWEEEDFWEDNQEEEEEDDPWEEEEEKDCYEEEDPTCCSDCWGEEADWEEFEKDP
jgi:hypothetical protein